GDAAAGQRLRLPARASAVRLRDRAEPGGVVGDRHRLGRGAGTQPTGPRGEASPRAAHRRRRSRRASQTQRHKEVAAMKDAHIEESLPPRGAASKAKRFAIKHLTPSRQGPVVLALTLLTTSLIVSLLLTEVWYRVQITHLGYEMTELTQERQ